MRWYGRAIRDRGRFPVVRFDEICGRDGVVLHEGLIADATCGDCVVWLVPYPGHPGGFLLPNGLVISKLHPQARRLSEAFALFGSPQEARLAADKRPYLSAIVYDLGVDYVGCRVRLGRMPADAGMDVYDELP